jgi:uncharacterized protein YihD (DUF1040 family)
MHDPPRIEYVLNTIRNAWYANPDLRLGQLLVNATSDDDLYYIEDEDLAADVEDYHDYRQSIRGGYL